VITPKSDHGYCRLAPAPSDAVQSAKKVSSQHIPAPSLIRRIYVLVFRWCVESRSWFESVWRRQWFGWLLILAFVLLYILWARHIPSPGKSVAALAALAALMAFRSEAGGFEKFVCMLVLIAFLLLEFQSIDQERLEAAYKEGVIRDAETKHFAEIAQGIEDTLRNSELQFRATMEKENSVLATTQTVGELTKRNLESVSGEGSVPCIIPQSHAVVNGTVPLVVKNAGLNNLTGVEVRLLSLPEFLDGASLFYKRPAELGTLRTEWAKPLPDGITPIPDKDGIAYYIAEIWTQNGYYSEVINFRRGKYLLPWAYQYWLQKRQLRVPPTKTDFELQKLVSSKCSQPAWSDDLGDGKPIAK
jgi:hypothetical protein